MSLFIGVEAGGGGTSGVGTVRVGKICSDTGGGVCKVSNSGGGVCKVGSSGDVCTFDGKEMKGGGAVPSVVVDVSNVVSGGTLNEGW